MKSEQIEFMSAILIVSRNPERLAAFYRDVLGLPLVGEEHGETAKHYGCELGDIHFAIHPVSNFEGTSTGTGAIKLAFSVFDMKAFVERVTNAGAVLSYPPEDKGFAVMTALNDPDGNTIEITQLADWWFDHLETRRKQGIDLLVRQKQKNLSFAAKSLFGAASRR